MIDTDHTLDYERLDVQKVHELLRPIETRLKEEGFKSMMQDYVAHVTAELKASGKTRFHDPNNRFSALMDDDEETQATATTPSKRPLSKKQKKAAEARAKAIAAKAKEKQDEAQDMQTDEETNQAPPTKADLKNKLQDKIEHNRIMSGRDTTTKVKVTDKAAKPADTEDMQVEGEEKPKEKYFEGRGGQNKIAYNMIIEGVERNNAADMLKVIYEILRKMRAYDSSLKVFQENGEYLDLETLRGAGDEVMDWVFAYTKEMNQHSGKWTFTVHISFMARQSLKNLKERGVRIPYLKQQRIQIKTGTQYKVPMERCGWISLVAKYTICDALYWKQIMDTITSNLTGKDINDIRHDIQEHTTEATDEYTEFTPDKLAGYLDLEWNTITIWANQRPDRSSCIGIHMSSISGTNHGEHHCTNL